MEKVNEIEAKHEVHPGQISHYWMVGFGVATKKGQPFGWP
jgi:hypothetical protein